jgi:hypothetical protein
LNQISSKNIDMENREHIKNEIEKEAPFLSRLEKENIFQVPENYFSDLPDNIHARIYRKKSSIVLPGFLFRPLTYYAFASLLLIIVALNMYVGQSNRASQEAEMFPEYALLEQLDEEVLIEYIMENEMYPDEEMDNITDYYLEATDEKFLINALL